MDGESMDSIQQAGEDRSLAQGISVILRVVKASEIQSRAFDRGQRGCCYLPLHCFPGAGQGVPPRHWHGGSADGDAKSSLAPQAQPLRNTVDTCWGGVSESWEEGAGDKQSGSWVRCCPISSPRATWT